jgi:hypothetical protein
MFLAHIVTFGSNIELQQNMRACPIVLPLSKITTKTLKKQVYYVHGGDTFVESGIILLFVNLVN